MLSYDIAGSVCSASSPPNRTPPPTVHSHTRTQAQLQRTTRASLFPSSSSKRAAQPSSSRAIKPIYPDPTRVLLSCSTQFRCVSINQHGLHAAPAAQASDREPEISRLGAKREWPSFPSIFGILEIHQRLCVWANVANSLWSEHVGEADQGVRCERGLLGFGDVIAPPTRPISN